ncbi:MAG: DivIVA domain-containing protein [Jatrophihabitans sp.]
MSSLLMYALLAIVVSAALVALLIVFVPQGRILSPVVAADSIPDGLPVDGALTADDVTKIRLPVALRGYRMVETDAILDRLASELEYRDALLERLGHPFDPLHPDRPLPGGSFGAHTAGRDDSAAEVLAANPPVAEPPDANPPADEPLADEPPADGGVSDESATLET